MPPEETREEEDIPYGKLPASTGSFDRYECLEISRSEEANQAEKWLTRGRRGLLVQWSNEETEESARSADRYDIETNVQSSLSSPGKASLKEKLQQRLQQRKESFGVQQPPRSNEMRSVDDILTRYQSNEMRPSSPKSPVSDSTLSTKQTPRNKLPPTRRRSDIDPSVLRLSRTVRYGRRGPVPHLPKRTSNTVRLHIYDLISNDTIMQLPWGIEFPIGQCFVTMNNGLNALGTGVYHCGIEINGIEYAYGANEIENTTGVFTCVPKNSPGYEYRTTIDFGERALHRQCWTKSEGKYFGVEKFVDGRHVIMQMASEYKGKDYDLLRKNCCTFAKDACLRLGINPGEIPSWFMNLADAGARTQDAASRTLSRLQPKPGSYIPSHMVIHQDGMEHPGYEMIHQERVVTIVEAVDTPVEQQRGHYQPQSHIGVRRTLSWTY